MQIVSLVKAKGVGDISKTDFNMVSFWVQIFNVPIPCEDEDCTRFWGNLIGIVEDVDLDGPDHVCSGSYRCQQVVAERIAGVYG